MAAAVCVSRVGRSRVRPEWSSLGVTGHRGRGPFVPSAACMGRDVRTGTPSRRPWCVIRMGPVPARPPACGASGPSRVSERSPLRREGDSRAPASGRLAAPDAVQRTTGLD
jgi:hypothetical protein